MQMSTERKKEVLLKNFEIIKKNYAENRAVIADVLIKMFALDEDTAIEMWKYLLKEYEEEVKNSQSWSITGQIIHDAGRKIGEGRIEQIVLDNPEIKHAVFSLTCDDPHIAVGQIVANKIASNKLEMADELLQLLYNNPYRNDSWYEIMDSVMPYAGDGEITNEAYDLLEMWCDKVANEEERAKLSIKMLDYID